VSPTLTRTQRSRVVVSLAGGVAAVAGSFGVAGAAPSFVAAPVANAVVRLAPGPLVTVAITVLGDLGSALASLAGLAATVALFGAATAAGRALATRTGRPAAAPVAVGGTVTLLGAVLVGPSASAGAAGVGAAVVAAVAGPVDATTDDGGDGVRRAVLSGVAALAVGALALGGRRLLGSAGAAATADPVPVPDDVAALLAEAEEKSLPVAGLEPLVSEEFYTVDIADVDPRPDPEEWRLRIHGAVAEEATFDLDDVAAMEHEHRFVTLRCVGERLNGRKLDTALWTGVPVADLLEVADPQGEYVLLRAADEYFEEFPLAALESGLLAVGMNGRPLPRAHGAPARALVPGHWGEINVKWLTEIEVLDEPATGYWEERGWHGTGPVNTVAKLWATNRLDDGRIEVAGAAYAGTRGVESVEVSTDGGSTWTTAALSEPLPGSDVWRQWVHRYEAASPHEVVVRATDGTGTLQPRERREAFPSGATGWVSETVTPRSL
jgi:DMSO/TMAO reductase YedYZ molybdopterin-dependent catalytic subunit